MVFLRDEEYRLRFRLYGKGVITGYRWTELDTTIRQENASACSDFKSAVHVHGNAGVGQMSD